MAYLYERAAIKLCFTWAIDTCYRHPQRTQTHTHTHKWTKALAEIIFCRLRSARVRAPSRVVLGLEFALWAPVAFRHSRECLSIRAVRRILYNSMAHSTRTACARTDLYPHYVFDCPRRIVVRTRRSKVRCAMNSEWHRCRRRWRCAAGVRLVLADWQIYKIKWRRTRGPIRCSIFTLIKSQGVAAVAQVCRLLHNLNSSWMAVLTYCICLCSVICIIWCSFVMFSVGNQVRIKGENEH